MQPPSFVRAEKRGGLERHKCSGRPSDQMWKTKTSASLKGLPVHLCLSNPPLFSALKKLGGCISRPKIIWQGHHKMWCPCKDFYKDTTKCGVLVNIFA